MPQRPDILMSRRAISKRTRSRFTRRNLSIMNDSWRLYGERDESGLYKQWATEVE